MRESLRKECEQFIINKETFKSVFKWDEDRIISACTLTLKSNNITEDIQNIMEAKEIVERETGVFSNFRGNVKIPLVINLAGNFPSNSKMTKIKNNYEKLRKHFSRTEYMVLVSMILADMISEAQVDDYAARGKKIYEMMKREHPFLTSSEDSVFAVLMAFSEKDNLQLIDDMERCYDILKKSFSDSNSVQALSHVLSLASGTPAEKCERVLKLYQGLVSAGKKYGKNYELPVLGAVSILPIDIKDAVRDIVEVDEFLSEKKGYGFFGMDKKTRLMHAAMIVSSDYSKDNDVSTAAITGTMAMLAAQQAAMCAMMASCAAASAAASSGA